MHRIDTPTAQVDKFGPGKNGFTRGNPQTGTPATELDDDYFDMMQEELATVVEATGVALEKTKHDQLLTALKKLLLSRSNPFADIKADGNAAIATALTNLGLGGGLTGIIGQSRNATLNITAASASATWTADELIVESVPGGTQYRLNNLNLSVNLATVGAGGMDAGGAPVSGYVALYVIYNPVSGAKALLAANATSVKVGEVYGGTAMPAGYTASALISVLPTNTSGLFLPVIQFDRTIAIPQATAVSTSSPPSSLTVLSIAGAVPPNAKSCSGSISATTSSVGQTVSGALSGSGNATVIGNKGFGGITFVTAPYYDLRIITQQTVYWGLNTTGGTLTGALTISEYKI